MIRHCGGFSAHRPYSATHPDHEGLQVVGPTGCWTYLDEAVRDLEGVLAGTHHVTSERCAPGVVSVQPKPAMDLGEIA